LPSHRNMISLKGKILPLARRFAEPIMTIHAALQTPW
jgi:hypothetical protein